MSVWYIDLLLWLFTLQVDPFVFAVTALVFVPYLIDGLESNDTKLLTVFGLGAAAFLYFPTVLADLIKFNATAVTQLSFATRSLGLYAYGNTLAESLILLGVTLSWIIRKTGTRANLVLSARKYSLGAGAALFILYFLYAAGIIR